MNGLWYMLKDHERYVYHYTRAVPLAEHILPTGKLRFSRFENVNDPREAKDWAFGFHSIATRIFDDTGSIQKTVNQMMKSRCRIGCFATDVYESLVTKEREDKGEDILGAAYERGHSRPRMWAQYADNFSGACLVFEKAKLDTKIRKAAQPLRATVSAGLVSYRNPRMVPNIGLPDPLMLSLDKLKLNGIERAVQDHIDTHLQELFFLKSKDWAQEREFRWVIHNDDDQEFFVAFEDALVGIAIGDRFPTSPKKAVGVYCLENDINIAEMRWHNGVPQPSPLVPRILSMSGD